MSGICTVATAMSVPRFRAVFLDRDGVINQPPGGHGYLTDWQDFRFADGALALLQTLAGKGYRLAVVTNQQGVGKGLVQPAALDEIHSNLCAEAARVGAAIEAICVCPHLASAGCDCRKPRPGLLYQAMAQLPGPLDLTQSWCVGDSLRDVAAGAAAGVRTLLVGKARSADGVAPDRIVGSLAEAAQVL